jgi:hypothetical protein
VGCTPLPKLPSHCHRVGVFAWPNFFCSGLSFGIALMLLGSERDVPGFTNSWSLCRAVPWSRKSEFYFQQEGFWAVKDEPERASRGSGAGGQESVVSGVARSTLF